MTRTKLRKNHAAIIASLRDKVAVITADRDDLEEQRQALNKMVDAAETRAATARREAFDEAIKVAENWIGLYKMFAAKGGDNAVDYARQFACEDVARDIRAARDRGTP